MKLDILDDLSDSDLQAVINRAGELLKLHDQERKETALAEAGAILAKAGLSLKDITRKGRGKAKMAPVYHAGRNYQHPTNRTLVWNGKGQKPNWLRLLEAEGGKAIEIEPANDNTPAPVRKAG